MKESGFTALEIVLSIAIMGFIVGATVTSIARFQTRNDLDLSVVSGVGALRRAEELSRAAHNDAQWGVKFATGTITIFQGSSYASRNSTFDEAIEIGPDIYASGTNEFVFTKAHATTTAATTTLVHNTIGESRTITVNKKGTIGY